MTQTRVAFYMALGREGVIALFGTQSQPILSRTLECQIAGAQKITQTKRFGLDPKVIRVHCVIALFGTPIK